MLVAGGVPEMHEAGVVERRRRLEARDMAAELRGFLVRLDHDGGGVPAHVAPDMLLERAVAGMDRLRLGGDGVDIGGVGGEGQPGAFPPRGGDDGIENVVDPAQTLKSFNGIKGVKPLVGLVVQGLDFVVHRAGPPMRLDESRSRDFLIVFSCAHENGNRGEPRRSDATDAGFAFRRSSDSARLRPNFLPTGKNRELAEFRPDRQTASQKDQGFWRLRVYSVRAEQGIFCPNRDSASLIAQKSGILGECRVLKTARRAVGPR